MSSNPWCYWRTTDPLQWIERGVFLSLCFIGLLSTAPVFGWIWSVLWLRIVFLFILSSLFGGYLFQKKRPILISLILFPVLCVLSVWAYALLILCLL